MVGRMHRYQRRKDAHLLGIVTERRAGPMTWQELEALLQRPGPSGSVHSCTLCTHEFAPGETWYAGYTKRAGVPARACSKCKRSLGELEGAYQYGAALPH